MFLRYSAPRGGSDVVFGGCFALCRRLLFAGILAMAMAPGIGLAAKWPLKSIKLVIPYPPGGGTDLVARLLAAELSQRLGEAVVVENRAGAGGRIGTQFVAQSAPDGYTLLFGTGAELTIAPSTVASMPYDPARDLEPISQIGKGPYILVASTKFAPNTLAGLVAYAKAHPGQVNYSSGGVFSAPHLLGMQFDLETGIDTVHVAYKGSGPSLVGLMGGQVQYTFNTPAVTLDLIKNGKLKAIAVATTRRLPKLPEVPTMSEAGLPGFVGGSWYGLLAPRGTPKAIIDRLNAETVRFVNLPKTRQTFLDLYIEPVGDTEDEFGSYIRSEIERYHKLVKVLGLKPE